MVSEELDVGNNWHYLAMSWKESVRTPWSCHGKGKVKINYSCDWKERSTSLWLYQPTYFSGDPEIPTDLSTRQEFNLFTQLHLLTTFVQDCSQEGVYLFSFVFQIDNPSHIFGPVEMHWPCHENIDTKVTLTPKSHWLSLCRDWAFRETKQTKIIVSCQSCSSWILLAYKRNWIMLWHANMASVDTDS